MHRITHGQGAAPLYFVPRDKLGRARRLSGVTYVIADLDYSAGDSTRTVASASATLDAVSTTLAAAAGPLTADALAVTVTSGTSIVANHAYLISEGARSEIVRVESISSASIVLASELRNAYTTSATFQGIEQVASFPADEADDDHAIESGGGPYAIDWSYTLDGVEYVVREPVWIDRVSITPSFATEAEFLEMFPGFARRTRNQEPPSRALAMASREYVARLSTNGKDAATHNSSIASLIVMYGAAKWIHRWMGDTELAETYADEYEKLLRSSLTGGTAKTIETEKQFDKRTTKTAAGKVRSS